MYLLLNTFWLLVVYVVLITFIFKKSYTHIPYRNKLLRSESLFETQLIHRHNPKRQAEWKAYQFDLSQVPPLDLPEGVYVLPPDAEDPSFKYQWHS